MAATSNAVKLKTVNSIAQSTSRKLSLLAAKAPYEAPKILSIPVNEMQVSDALSLMGNQ
jgi:hypothetical protein